MQVCFIKRDILLNGEPVSKNLLCAIIEDDTVISASNLCQDANLFTKYREQGVQFGFMIDPTLEIPLVALEESGLDSFMDVSAIYALVSNYLEAQHLDALPDEVSKAIILKLCDLGYDKISAAYYVASCLDLWQYQHSGNVSGIIDVRPDYYDADFYQFTSSYVMNNNQGQVNPFTLISEVEDVTKFQDKCTDELFVHIPLPHELTADSSLQSFMPKRDEISKPYGNLDLADMTMYKDVGSPFSPQDYPLIEGSAANNELGIQDNEQLFYQSLTDWVKFNMHREFGDEIDVSPSNPNIDLTSQEYLLELLECFYSFYWKHNPNVPDINESYDEESSNVDSKYVFKASEEEQSLYRQGFSEFTTGSLHINAIEMLKSFVQKAALSIGYKAYVEAIIKVARWGERKCTALSLSDYPTIFLLGTNQEKEKIGNIEDYVVEPVDGLDYKPMCPIYESILLTDSKYFKGLGYEKNHLVAPIGLYTVKHLVNQKNQKSIDVNMNYSLIDVVQLLKEGKCEIAGFGYKDGIISAPDIPMDNLTTASKLLTLYREQSEDDVVQEHFYRSEVLQNLYLEFNAIQGNQPVKPNHFTILQGKYASTSLEGEFKRQKITSKADYEERRANGVLRSSASAIIDTNVASVIIPIYVEVSKRFRDDMTFTEVLQLYADVMAEMNYTAENAFLTTDNSEADKSSEDEATTDVKASDVTPELKAMDAFSKKESAKEPDPVSNVVPQEEATTEESKQTSTVGDTTADTVVKEEEYHEEEVEVTHGPLRLIKSIPAGATYYPLLSRDKQVIGGFTLSKGVNQKSGKGFNIFTLVTEERYKSAENKGDSSITFYKLLPNLMYDLCAVEAGKDELIRVYFEDTATMNQYLLVINSLVKSQEL